MIQKGDTVEVIKITSTEIQDLQSSGLSKKEATEMLGWLDKLSGRKFKVESIMGAYAILKDFESAIPLDYLTKQ